MNSTLYTTQFCCSIFSARSPAVGTNKRRVKTEEEEDLTRDMDDPVAEPNIQEVTLPKPNPASRSQRDVETQPVKGGSLMDIEEEAENVVSNI